jgi:hypothetical protein
MSTRVLLFCACAARACSLPYAAAREASLCHTHEQVMCHCQLSGTPTLLSVCLGNKVGAQGGYLQYRFGTAGHIELEYPTESPEGEGTNFAAFRYSPDERRARVQVLSFTMGDNPQTATTYAVFAGQRPLGTPAPRFFGGVRVQQGAAGVAKDLVCRDAPTERLAELEALVAPAPAPCAAGRTGQMRMALGLGPLRYRAHRPAIPVHQATVWPGSRRLAVQRRWGTSSAVDKPAPATVRARVMATGQRSAGAGSAVPLPGQTRAVTA